MIRKAKGHNLVLGKNMKVFFISRGSFHQAYLKIFCRSYQKTYSRIQLWGKKKNNWETNSAEIFKFWELPPRIVVAPTI